MSLERKSRTVPALAGFIVVVIALLWQRQNISGLRGEIATLEGQAGAVRNLRAERDRLSAPGIDSDELGRLRLEHDELLRLRGQYALLMRGVDSPLPGRTNQEMRTNNSHVNSP